MKRILSLFLVCLVALACAAGTVRAEAGAALPAPGDVVEGFQVLETRGFPMVGGDLVLFEHVQTGAKLILIKNGDKNRTFDLSFMTRPADDTGIPHVFEHSILKGSDKYPAKSLFFSLMNQTYNTYMNASTSQTYTTYPVASLSEKQLLRYADYYTDSCLHPSILHDESIFREEAWRYRMESEEAPLTLEGTVYSEMQGAMTLERAATYHEAGVMFPGSQAARNPGGDPDAIPDMTYENLRRFHEQYYHPSNCLAFLYGDLEDYAAFLKLLDEAFRPYERREFTFEDTGYTPITEKQEAAFTYPVEQNAQTADVSEIFYGVVLPGMKDNPGDMQVMRLLATLLSQPASPLMQKLEKAIPTGDFGVALVSEGPEYALGVTANQVNPGDEGTIRQIVEEALADVAENGFDQAFVEAAAAPVRLEVALMAENHTIGVTLASAFASMYSTSDNPFMFAEYVDSLGKLAEWNSEGRYRDVAARYLKDNPLNVMVTTSPVAGGREERAAALAAKLEETKAGMSGEEKAEIIRASLAERETEDTDAMIASLKAVSVSSLPEEMRIYDVSDTTGEDSVRRLRAVAEVDGIGFVGGLLDIRGLEQEDVLYLNLLAGLAGEIDTAKHTADELDSLTSRYMYNGSLKVTPMREGKDGYIPYLYFSWIGADEDLPTAYDLVYELLFETRLDDAQAVRDQIASKRAALHSTINNSGYVILYQMAIGNYDDMFAFDSYVNFLPYYAFLTELEAKMDEDPQAVLDRLARVQEQVRNSMGAVSLFAGSEKSIQAHEEAFDAFLARLDKREVVPATYDLPRPPERFAIITDTNVQFNVLQSGFKALGMEGFDASVEAVLKLVTDTYLVPQLRDQYGVYTPMSATSEDLGVLLLTYRDPNIVETFQVYDSLADQIASLETDQEKIDGYILAAYANYASSTGELTGAYNAMARIVSGRSQDDPLTYMRQLKQVTPETVRESAQLFRTLSEKGIRATCGSASAIHANEGLYEQVYNPFGVEDLSQAELKDVTEDDPAYAAIQFVLSSGLMTPASADAFGVSEPATVGDFLAAVYAAIGGTPNSPEEAVSVLSGYGIVPSGAEAGTELTHGMYDAILAGFLTIAGQPTDGLEPSGEEASVMTRGEVAQQLVMLFSQP